MSLTITSFLFAVGLLLPSCNSEKKNIQFPSIKEVIYFRRCCTTGRFDAFRFDPSLNGVLSEAIGRDLEAVALPAERQSNTSENHLLLLRCEKEVVLIPILGNSELIWHNRLYLSTHTLNTIDSIMRTLKFTRLTPEELQELEEVSAYFKH